MNVAISAERLSELDSATKSWLMDLITRNMKALYEKSDWGWKTANFMLRVMRSISHDLVAESNNRSGGSLISFPQKSSTDRPY